MMATMSIANQPNQHDPTDSRNAASHDGNPFSGFLTKKQLCAIIPGGPISERTLDRMHTLGTGPPQIKYGRKIVFDSRAISAWLKSKTQDPVRSGAVQ
jgi:predicted DNA-binding transcriptional regulator AlpA